MILVWLLALPLAAGLLAWLLGRWNDRWPRWVCLAAITAMLLLAGALWVQQAGSPAIIPPGAWLAEVDEPWIPQLGIHLHLAVDGLSLLLVLLTGFLGIVSVTASWTEIRERVGFFHFNLMWVLAGIVGVFLSIDLFLFYFFWEVMLVPMYFLIALWGHENRIYAAVKFFLFTQVSGLLMLVAILGLYLVHHRVTGTYTFNFTELTGTSMPAATARWLMMGFLAAFAVKLPAVPVHTWLADAHTEAPTAGSVILAGLLLKTGAYGMLRFVLPLFPQAALDLAPVAMVLGVVGILYGALLAFGQTDLKRLVAYTSVSHMGFVLLGTFTGSRLALQGVVMQMICHGISTGALFALVGALQERTHTRDMRRMGGLWSVMPRFGGVALLFALAGMGLPGLGNFIGEFLVLLGTYAVSPLLTVLAALGLVGATVYALWFIQVTFHGPNREGWSLPDLSVRETLTAGALILAIVWLGIYPQPVFDTADGALRKIQQAGAVHPHPAPEGVIQAGEPGEGGPSAAHAVLMSRHETGTPHTEQTDGAR